MYTTTGRHHNPNYPKMFRKLATLAVAAILSVASAAATDRELATKVPAKVSSFSVCADSTLSTHWNGPVYTCNADGSPTTTLVGTLGYVCGPAASSSETSLCLSQLAVTGTKKKSVLNFSFTKLGSSDSTPIVLQAWYVSPSTGYFKGAENKISNIAEQYNSVPGSYTWTFTYATKGWNPLA